MLYTRFDNNSYHSFRNYSVPVDTIKELINLLPEHDARTFLKRSDILESMVERGLIPFILQKIPSTEWRELFDLKELQSLWTAEKIEDVAGITYEDLDRIYYQAGPSALQIDTGDTSTIAVQGFLSDERIEKIKEVPSSTKVMLAFVDSHIDDIVRGLTPLITKPIKEGIHLHIIYDGLFDGEFPTDVNSVLEPLFRLVKNSNVVEVEFSALSGKTNFLKVDDYERLIRLLADNKKRLSQTELHHKHHSAREELSRQENVQRKTLLAEEQTVQHSMQMQHSLLSTEAQAESDKKRMEDEAEKSLAHLQKEVHREAVAVDEMTQRKSFQAQEKSALTTLQRTGALLTTEAEAEAQLEKIWRETQSTRQRLIKQLNTAVLSSQENEERGQVAQEAGISERLHQFLFEELCTRRDFERDELGQFKELSKEQTISWNKLHYRRVIENFFLNLECEFKSRIKKDKPFQIKLMIFKSRISECLESCLSDPKKVVDAKIIEAELKNFVKEKTKAFFPKETNLKNIFINMLTILLAPVGVGIIMALKNHSETGRFFRPSKVDSIPIKTIVEHLDKTLSPPEHDEAPKTKP